MFQKMIDRQVIVAVLYLVGVLFQDVFGLDLTVEALTQVGFVVVGLITSYGLQGGLRRLWEQHDDLVYQSLKSRRFIVALATVIAVIYANTGMPTGPDLSVGVATVNFAEFLVLFFLMALAGMTTFDVFKDYADHKKPSVETKGGFTKVPTSELEAATVARMLASDNAAAGLKPPRTPRKDSGG